MKRRHLIAGCIAVLICIAFGASVARAADVTVQDVIDKNINARGGREKMAAIKSMQTVGTLTLGPGVTAQLLTEIVRPDKARMDFTLQGQTFIRVYNHGDAWGNAPGQPDIGPLPADFYRDMQETSDLEGPLVDYKAKGHTIELQGKEKPRPNMPEMYKLKVTMKNGRVIVDFIDTETGLEMVQRVMEGNDVGDEVVYTEWKDVEGVKFPNKLTIKANGADGEMTYVVDKVEVNGKVDETRFKKPDGIKGDTSKPLGTTKDK